jgi:hypothetical protein
VKCSPGRFDLGGASRDEVALREAQTNIFPKAFFLKVKYPG